MPASQDHVHAHTPMGANLAPDGATFRVWAPAARQVFVVTDELAAARSLGAAWSPRESDALVRRDDGTWAGFVAGIADGSPYRFWVAGEGGSGFKRDPYARELGTDPSFPDCDCLVRDPASYPWHDQDWRPPEFRDLVIYQLHVGVFHAADGDGGDARERRTGRFLDLTERLDHLRDLGVNAILLLPIQEYPSQFSMGYNGTDYFSPEMDYQVEDEGELARYLEVANARLAARGHAPLATGDLRPGPNQLKLVIDLCHLEGIAVLFDLVYNHAGGGFDDQSLYFLDFLPRGSNDDSLYFTKSGWAGGLVFAYWKQEVRRFLIDNARFFLGEYHADGIRYDEVGVMDDHGGWSFCQELSQAVRDSRPQAIQVAEYWKDHRWLAVTPPPGGMGFDAALSDGLRDRLRGAVEQAAHGREARVEFGPVRDALQRPQGFPSAWRAVQCLENHDLVYADRPPEERRPRLAALAGGGDARSWWARSRTRAATGILLTAPGIPLLFMGQEILEDKPWSDNPPSFEGTLIWWEGLASDRAMRDHLAFTRDLVRLRRRLPALRAERTNVFHANDEGRVLAFHRWIEGSGDDVVVIASLSETTYPRYELGLPLPGAWREVFNSDFYDQFPNPDVVGNGGSVAADGPAMHGFAHSAGLTIPANGLLVLARGD